MKGPDTLGTGLRGGRRTMTMTRERALQRSQMLTSVQEPAERSL